VAERLDKFVAHASGLSRKRVLIALRGGRVELNGAVVKKGALQVGDGDRVVLDGEPLAARQPRYLMLHKPAGVTSTSGDAPGRTAFELLDQPQRDRLHLAGRLDRDATGLLLLTDDGAWSHRVTAPRSHCVKVYRVELAVPLQAGVEALFAAGLMLNGEDKPTLPAGLLRESETRVRVALREGRYHQVKRMFAAVGNRVTALHREAVGGLALGDLAPGEYRELGAAECAAVFDPHPDFPAL